MPKTITKTCIHHWMIDPPLGQSSHGICKYCGAEKEFDNYPDAKMRRAVVIPDVQMGIEMPGPLRRALYSFFYEDY